MSEINNEVFESPKVKKKRKPMTPEAKQALIERLAAGREAKKNKKKEQAKQTQAKQTQAKQKPSEPKPEPEPEPEPQAKQPEPKPEPEPKPDNSLEMKALQDQINSMKLEKLEALEKKNEKKRATIEKRRATMNRKAIEKAAKNEVTKPAPIRKPVQKMEIIEEQAEQTASRKMSIDEDDDDRALLPEVKKPRYSTFKRSVWSSL